LSWLNGACIAGYAGLREKYLRHHADRLDVVTFDYRAVLKRAPRWVGRAVVALAWAQVPAVELLMRALMIGEPFTHGTARSRMRMTAVLLVRGAFFTVLALGSVKGLLLYAFAYLLFLTVLRFMDAFPAVPWHDLPALHRSLYADADRQVIPCRTLFANYHRHKVARVRRCAVRSPPMATARAGSSAPLASRF
jgi:hypothetical protein